MPGPSSKPQRWRPIAALCLTATAVAALSGCVSNPPVKSSSHEAVVERRAGETANAAKELPAADTRRQTPATLAGSEQVDVAATAASGPSTHGPESGASNAVAQTDARNVPASAALLRRFADQLAPQQCSRPATERRIEVIGRQKRAIERKFERVLPLLDYVLTAMEKADLPSQFALIPWAESGFRADPGNRGGVQGLWQFTSSTGKAHGLRIDNHYDGRRAAIESTAAAVEHLTVLMRQFGDWRLAALAYNAGPNRVARGLRDLPEGSERVPVGLAPHTIAYLNRIAALACVLADPDSFSPQLSQLDFEPLTVVERPTYGYSTALIAQAAGIELQALLDYNAGFRRGDVADNAPPGLLLPLGAASRLERAVAMPGNPSAPRPPPRSEPTYVVSVGDTLWQIARRYGVALGDLLRWNKISRTKVIRPGDVLRITPTTSPDS